MANDVLRRRAGFWLLLICFLINSVRAAPRFQPRDMHPVYDLGLDEDFIADVQEKFPGPNRWVVEPRHEEEESLWRLQKRVPWYGDCGGASEGAYFVAATSNRIFQMRCNSTWLPANTIATGLVVALNTLMQCIDRCSTDTYFNYAPNGCRVAQLDNGQNCRMLVSTAGQSYSSSSILTTVAIASYITNVADCNAGVFNTVASPLFTPCTSYGSLNFATRTPSAIAPVSSCPTGNGLTTCPLSTS
jgi:hypothetical protein